MARLHEHQGKALLRSRGFAVPRGSAVRTPDEARRVASELGGRVVLKIQAWTTARKALGGIAFASSPDEAADAARRLLTISVGSFPVEELLVEDAIDIARELFISLSIDERLRRPVILLSLAGGSGIEERAAEVHRLDCHVERGPDRAAIDAILASSDLPAAARPGVARAIVGVFDAARASEARSLEINPLAITRDGRVVAADCRVTIDDYAAFRHPELGIEIARELDHPPTPLEKQAYRVEQQDHRGTFFFARLNAGSTSDSLIGFHGAGGGGSMMSMDAATAQGFVLANFCDTSGNPSPAKVYRAARIILSQPGLVGYFGSGSGVANQEQFWSAYGLAKAFLELELDIPAVIRLGGNTEDRACEILTSACAGLPAKVEAYKKTDPPARIAARLAELIVEARRAGTHRPWTPRPPKRPAFVGAASSIRFELKGGRLWIDPAAWRANAPAIIARAAGSLQDDAGRPAPTLTPEAFAGKDSELIACEIECRRDGIPGVFVELDMPA